LQLAFKAISYQLSGMGYQLSANFYLLFNFQDATPYSPRSPTHHDHLLTTRVPKNETNSLPIGLYPSRV